MDKDWILIRYGEIALKSDPVRERFEHRLMDNIRRGLERGGTDGKVKRGYGRIFVNTKEVKKASDVLKRTFGIVSFSPCVKIDADLEKVVEKLSELGSEILAEDESFSVRARRTGNHEFSSKDVEREAGSRIIEETGAEVDLDEPDRTVFADVRQGQAYVFDEKIGGPGGMPLGTQGSVISLFKGDYNSFLATWLMMKRGCSVTLLHGNLEPYCSGKNVDRGIEELKKWDHGAPIDVIQFDFGQDLFEFQENADKGLTCLLCKRFLIRLASEIASRENLKAIVSGEGSDRSLEHLKMEDSVTKFPVIRPLMGYGVEEARKKCKDIAGNFILETEKCKAKSDENIEINEEDLEEAEDYLNFEELLKNKLEEVSAKNENT